MLSRIGFNNRTSHDGFMLQQIKNRSVYTVVVAIRVRTMLLLAAHFLLKTYFILRRNRNRMQPQPLLLHKLQRILRCRPRRRAGR
ncbi:hypothetical protein D3C77_560470 [compost metagenome]